MSLTFRFVGFAGPHEDTISRLIKAGCYGFWAVHVEARMPDGMLLGAHMDGGVAARPPGYDAGEFDREEFVTVPTDDATADKFHAFLRAQLGKPYDMECIAALAAGALAGMERNWREPDHWFCSELVAAAAEACGWAPKMVVDVTHITPRDWRMHCSARGY